ncbi:MAG TPA: hypothetical protein PLZ36_02330, partial [Armatimonadota bacterium]|nr:hypothetical protein [Armatimonadota bacterium]
SIMPPVMATAVAGTAPSTRPITPVSVSPVLSPRTAPTAAEPVRDLLALIADKLDALATQPQGNTVVTLDGREIARAVYRDVREQRIRRYE